MSAPCCRWHTTTCGHQDVCCDRCPSLEEGLGALISAVIAGVLLLALWAVGLG